MKALFLGVSLFVLVAPMFAQEDFTAIHREDFARWAQLTSLSPADIHRMWRATSQYGNEADDDSSIDLVDVSSLLSRNQILMVTSAGLPRCITVAVFSSNRPPFSKIWQVEQTPDGRGFCDKLDTSAAVNVARSGAIEITAVTQSEDAERPEVHTYRYKWDGNSYLFDTNVPPAEHAKSAPGVRARR